MPLSKIVQSSVDTGVAGSGPAFKAFGSVASVPAGLGNAVTFTSYSTPIFDTASAFNTSTGRFTPPVAGYYQVNCMVSYGSNGAGNGSVVVGYLYKNGSNTSMVNGAINSGGFPNITWTDVIYMNGTTDYLTMGTGHNGSGAISTVACGFSGFLVRAA